MSVLQILNLILTLFIHENLQEKFTKRKVASSSLQQQSQLIV